MKINRAFRQLFSMFAIILLLVCLAVPAFADAGIDMERNSSIELKPIPRGLPKMLTSN